jgi:DNA-binding Lrp family transcriptional regulator
MLELDTTDQKLISLLKSNARMPVVEMAKKLCVSRATVQNRIVKLEKNGVIVSYTVNLKPDINENPIRAVMTIKADGRYESKIARTLKGQPSIVALHSTNGGWDLIAEIHTDTLESFNKILNNVRLIEGIAATETSLLLDSYKL